MHIASQVPDLEGTRPVEEPSTQPSQSGKRKAIEDTAEPASSQQREMPLEETPVDVEKHKEELCAEEQVLKRLLNDWRNIDDRFIPIEEK